MTTRELRDLMARTVRPWTFAEMTEVTSKNGASGLIRRGEVVRILPNLYTAAMHSESWVARAQAALRWVGPEGALAGMSALYVWDVVEQPAHVTIVTPWTARPRSPEWLRVKRFVSAQATTHYRGFRVVSPELAAITGHAELEPGGRAEAVYAPMRRGLVTPASLAEALEGIGRIRGRRELEGRIAHAAAGAESYLEEAGGADVLVGPDFAGLLRQHWVVADGEAFRLDTFDPESLTNVEFDGFAHHGSREAQERDKARDARLASIGIQAVRFTYEQVTKDPEWCRRIAVDTMTARRLHGGLSVPGSPESLKNEDGASRHPQCPGREG